MTLDTAAFTSAHGREPYLLSHGAWSFVIRKGVTAYPVRLDGLYGEVVTIVRREARRLRASAIEVQP